MAQVRLEQRRIGTRFMVTGYGETRVMRASYEACACCAFRSERCTEIVELGPCTQRDRKDKQNIIFRLVNRQGSFTDVNGNNFLKKTV